MRLLDRFELRHCLRMRCEGCGVKSGEVGKIATPRNTEKYQQMVWGVADI
jgi:hypothetical protein